MRKHFSFKRSKKGHTSRVAVVLAFSLMFTSIFGIPGLFTDVSRAAVEPAPQNQANVIAKADALLDAIKDCFQSKINTDAFRTKYNEVAKKYVYYLNAEKDRDNQKIDLTSVPIDADSSHNVNLIKSVYSDWFPADTFTDDEKERYIEDMNVISVLRSKMDEGSNTYPNAFTNLMKMMNYAYNTTKKILEWQTLTPLTLNNQNKFNEILTGKMNPKDDSERGITNENSNGFLDLYYYQFGIIAGMSHFENCLIDKADVTQNDILMEYLIDNVNGEGGFLSNKVNRFAGFTCVDANGLVKDATDEDKTLQLEAEYRIENDSRAKNLHSEVFAILLKYYNIEKKYKETREAVDNLIDQYGMSETVRGRIEELIAVLEANGGEAVYINLYNGQEIAKFINNYKKVVEFLEELNKIQKTPETQTEINEAKAVYNIFENLTGEQQLLVPDDDLVKLINFCGVDLVIKTVISNIEEAKTKMDALQTGKDAAYEAFSDSCIKARNLYDALVKAYPKANIAEMITQTNVNTLNNMATVKEFLDRVRTILLYTADDKMCERFKMTIQPIYDDYDKLDSVLKKSIYNWDGFITVYNDVKAAYELRERIDSLNASFIRDDEKEFNSIYDTYKALNPKALAYFGETYKTTLEGLKKALDDINAQRAKRVIELINKIATVTVDSGRKINDAEQAYGALTDNEKKLVTNYDVLVKARAEYNALRADLSFAKLSGMKTSFTYTGSAIKPVPVVKIDGNVLVKGTDYILKYSSNKNVGKAHLTVTAVDGGKYSGEKSVSFNITKRSISGGTVSGVKSKYNYTGKAIKPSLKLKVNGKTLKKGKDYTYKYKNNKKKGKATIVISGKGNYKGTKKKTFKIV